LLRGVHLESKSQAANPFGFSDHGL